MNYDANPTRKLVTSCARYKQHPDLAKRMSRAVSQAVCKIAAKKVLNKALHLCKENVRSLLINQMP